MPVNNELNTRKQTLTALGITGPSNNERAYNKTLAAGLTSINTKTKAQVVALVALTDSSGGTANNAVEVIPAATAATTDTTAASLASVNTAITAIKNDVADLAAKINAVIAALKA